VITAEIIIVALFLISLFDLAAAKTVGEILFRIVSLILFGFFGYLLIKSVISEIRQREKVQKVAAELRRVNARLKELDKAKSEFVSIASHQLRTPLTAIKSILNMMENGDFGELNKVQETYISKAFNSNERLIKLVNDLLNISRIETGRGRMNIKPIRLEDLVISVIDELERQAKGKNLSLIFEKPSQKIPLVEVDSDQIRQAVINLVDNAIKFTEKGSITLSLSKAGTFVVFKSKDTGVGISKEDLPTLFHKFVRGQYESSKYIGGTGLGLYVVKKIIEVHGGQVWVESGGPGQGSTFYFKLPILKKREEKKYEK
jgi:signal transduction histidine kinase